MVKINNPNRKYPQLSPVGLTIVRPTCDNSQQTTDTSPSVLRFMALYKLPVVFNFILSTVYFDGQTYFSRSPQAVRVFEGIRDKSLVTLGKAAALT